MKFGANIKRISYFCSAFGKQMFKNIGNRDFKLSYNILKN